MLLRPLSSVCLRVSGIPSALRFVTQHAAAPSAKTRNLGIIAHIDAGKTTTTERMLYYSGFTPRIGDVDEGNTVMDYLPAERERGITIQSAAITFPWQDHRLNLIDTPGHADFTFEVERSLRVLDGAVVILDAVAGVEAQTEKVWRQANTRNIPKLMFINKMDRTGAGFGRTIREAAAKLQCHPLTLQLPIFETDLDGGDFIGVVDLLRQECLVWSAKSDGKSVDITPLAHYPNAMLVGEAGRAREAMIETLSELDEDVVDAYLECEDADKIPVHTLASAITRLCHQSQLIPVFCGASFRNIGVQPLLDGIVQYLPDPSERPAVTYLEEGSTFTLQPDSPPCALAFKVIIDPQRGPMVFVRVYSGVFTKGTVIYNNTTKSKERVMKILQMYADEAREIDSVGAGNIAVLLGLKETKTGDTITLAKHNKKSINLQPIEIPPPVFIATLETTSTTETKSLDLALENLLREDPSLRVSHDDDTGQTLLSGMGELHLEIAGNRLIHDFKAKAEIGKLRIGYRESIDSVVRCEDLHDRMIGGVSSTVRLSVRLSPMTTEEIRSNRLRMSEGNLIETSLPTRDASSPATATVDFASSDAEIALRNGALVSLSRGLIFGFQMYGIKAELMVEQYEADTSLGTLTSAARVLVQRALQEVGEAGMAVMEPIVSVSVSVQADSMGAVMNDLSGIRGGHIISLDETDEVHDRKSNFYAPPDSTIVSGVKDAMHSTTSTINARVPLKEMVGYSRALRALTGGRGNFTMSVDSFERMTQRGLQQLRQTTLY